MSEKREPVGKELFLLRTGAMLTRSEGEVSEFSEDIARLMKDDAFYHDKEKFIDGTNKWYVRDRYVKDLTATLPELSYLPVPPVRMSDTSERWDCLNGETGKRYFINKEEDWRVIYPTKEDGKAIDSKGRRERTLICPEEECGLELCTKLRRGTRSLARMPNQENKCIGCGKTSDSSGERDSLPEDHEWTEPHRVAPIDYAILHPYIHEHGSGSGYSGSSGHGGGGSSIYRPIESGEPEMEYYRPVPQHDSQPDLSEAEPTEEEPPLTPDEPAVVPGSELDRPSLSQGVEPPAEEKTIGHYELSRKTLVLGALVLIGLMLVLWMFFQ